jgi:N6-adenosine-specific RNA methylase IME4
LIPFPNKKYNIIYCDPAWYFKAYSDKGNKRSAVQHYNCMSINDIYDLPVNTICSNDCILFIWVIDPMLPEAMEVIKRWGFKYKTVAFTWVKENKKSEGYFTGLGYWTRANPEMCLLATKGKPKRLSKAVKQLIISKRQEHSKKPDEIRNRIIQLCGDLPKIELFARQRVKGWDCWGNQV